MVERAPATRNRASTKKWMRYEMENGRTLMYELTPVGIVVTGNTAVTHYSYSSAFQDREGERETFHGRHTDVLVKKSGAWRFVAWRGGDMEGSGG